MENQHVVVIPADENDNRSLSLGGQRIRVCPASAYLGSLQSEKSKATMTSFLSVVARLIGDEMDVTLETYRDYDWSLLDRTKIQVLMSLLAQEGRGPATVNTYLYAMRGVVRESWALGYVTQEHYAHCQAIKPMRGSRLSGMQVLGEDEIRGLLQVCSADTSELGVRDYTIFHLMLAAGLRRSEVVGLDVEDISFGRGEVKILGKGNKQRIAQIPRETLDLLDYWIDQIRGDSPGPLFTRIRRWGAVTQDRLTSQAIYYLLEKRCFEAGMQMFSPHDLRATFGTMMLDDGNDLVVVRDAMGHESVKTTERYIIRDNSKLRAAADAHGSRLRDLERK